jgi:excisionase family DNA binding protein
VGVLPLLPGAPRATLSVEEAGRILGIGRSAAYEAARRGQLPTIRIGRRLLVPLPMLQRLLEVGRATDLMGFVTDWGLAASTPRTVLLHRSGRRLQQGSEPRARGEEPPRPRGLSVAFPGGSRGHTGAPAGTGKKRTQVLTLLEGVPGNSIRLLEILLHGQSCRLWEEAMSQIQLAVRLTATVSATCSLSDPAERPCLGPEPAKQLAEAG